MEEDAARLSALEGRVEALERQVRTMERSRIPADEPLGAPEGATPTERVVAWVRLNPVMSVLLVIAVLALVAIVAD